MTEYQKKKLIDLILVIIAIIIVGLFLRTQLINPIIIETETTSEEPLEINDGRIITDQFTTELYKSDAIAIQSINRNSDDQYMDLLLVLNSFEDINVEDFTIEIELTSDDTYTVFLHSTGGKTLSEIIAHIEDAYFKNSAGEVLSEISVSNDRHQVQIQLQNSKRLNLEATMPMKVRLKYKLKDFEITQFYPEQ